MPRIAVTQCSVSSRPVYITRHLSQLFVSGDIDSFLRLRSLQLKLSYLLSRYRILRPSLSSRSCSSAPDQQTHISASCSARHFVEHVPRLMRFLCFCFERSRFLRVAKSMGRCKYSVGFVKYTKMVWIYFTTWVFSL